MVTATTAKYESGDKFVILSIIRTLIRPLLRTCCSFTVLKVQIVSTGCSDPPARGRDCARAPASIKVNGLERSLSRRGLNIVVYNFATGRYEGTRTFDTHGNRGATNLMIRYIDSIKPNRLVFVAAQDSYTAAMNARAYSALVSIFNPLPFTIEL